MYRLKIELSGKLLKPFLADKTKQCPEQLYIFNRGRENYFTRQSSCKNLQ